MQFQREADELKKSYWPRCDVLADQLAAHGVAASEALLYASKARTHQVRSACVRALFRIDEPSGRELAKRLLADRAYEVRETAAILLGVPIP